MKTFKTTSNTYFFSINEDGSLFITYNGKDSIPNAGMFINSMGGIEAIIARADDKEYTQDDIDNYLAARWQAQKDSRKRQAEIKANRDRERGIKYASMFAELKKQYEGKAIPSTPDNIRIVLNNARYNGEELPAMTVGYSLNLYDCDGTLAAAMKLDNPIDYDGEMTDKFVTGAPHGHLIKYSRI